MPLYVNVHGIAFIVNIKHGYYTIMMHVVYHIYQTQGCLEKYRILIGILSSTRK